MTGREPVGVLGGSFDPVHLGHLHAASVARRALGLRRVLLVPCARPPHKPHRELTPAEHRLAMLRLAVAGIAGVEIGMQELERGGVSYTIDTLRALASGPSPLVPVFVLGSDALVELPSWKQWRELAAEFDLAAVDRAEVGPDALRRGLPPELSRRIVSVAAGPPSRATLAELDPGAGGRIFVVSAPPLGVSSSLVRRRAASGSSLDGLVPPEVGRYIERSGLYREEATS